MYISVNEAAAKFKVSKRRVQVLCEQGRIRGASFVSGAWLIPDTAVKPSDGRKRNGSNNQIGIFDTTEKMLSIDDVCKALSISKATAKNWVRLGKITPDAGECLFSREYIEQFIDELKSTADTKLKSRRNKKSATGKFLYRSYVHTPENQKTVEELLEMDIVQTQSDLLIVLANFAVQLYYQSRGIQYAKNNVLSDFLAQDIQSEFHVLIADLLGDLANIFSSIDKLQLALSKGLLFTKGEDSLGLVYISLRDVGFRKSSGTYYTPERVVKTLIDSLYDNDTCLNHKTFFDPCCGTGNFLLYLGREGIAFENLYGQDIDPTSVHLARINVALMAPQLSALELCSRIRIGNTFFKTFDVKFDFIIGNPPWGSNLSEDDSIEYCKLYRTAVGKSIESYDLFVEKALSMLRPNGVLAFVLPEAILSVAAHSTVRKLLLESCSFTFVSYLGNVFSGVQCPAIILGVTLNKTKSVRGCRVTIGDNSFIITQERKMTDEIFSFNISDEENECLEAIGHVENAAYLKDNARFALGIVTGNNKDFISREMHEGYEIVLKGSDIQRYGINPSEAYIRFTPEFFQQVAPIEMYRAEKKLVYRFISEVPVFAYDDRQTLSLNSCNIVIPEIPGLEIKYVLAILNSSVAAYYISKKFNSVKLLRSHIEQMPIPVVTLAVQGKLIEKVDRIMNSSENSSALYAELDNDIIKLFGLSDVQIKTIHAALEGKNRFLIAN